MGMSKPSTQDLHALNELTVVVAATVAAMVGAAILLSLLGLEIWWSVLPAGIVAMGLLVRARRRFTLDRD